MYKFFVLLLVIKKLIQNICNVFLIDIIEDVHQVIVFQIETLLHKTGIALIPEIDIVIKELLLLHSLPDEDMTTIDEILVLIVHHTDLHFDHNVDEIHALDLEHVHFEEIH